MYSVAKTVYESERVFGNWENEEKKKYKMNTKSKAWGD